MAKRVTLVTRARLCPCERRTIMIAVAREPVRPPAALQSDAERWAAVLRRDPRADGTFYYSVKTTGVYCRPSCPSRRPRFENVAFHTTREGAEGAGFRPCKRCRPDARGLAEQHAAAAARACRLIETSEEPPSLEVLAKAAGMSRFHFHRTFKAVTGVTPWAYASAHRAERVREALTKSASVTEASTTPGSTRMGASMQRRPGCWACSPRSSAPVARAQ